VRTARAKRMPDDIYFVVSMDEVDHVVIAKCALEDLPKKHAA
jgi:hypothetical protein